MQIMGRVVGNIYRALELAFREQLDGFTRCPACSGCGLATNTRNCFSKLNGGQSCWFCEGHGLLPLTLLKGFVPCYLPPIRTELSSSTATSLKPSIHQINYSARIKFQQCAGRKRCLFSTLKCPAWFADAQCDAEPSALYAKTTEFQDVIFFRPCPLNTAYRSVVLLIMGLLSPVFSSNSANARANSASQSPGIERVKDDDNRLKDSDNVFQMGEELGGYREPRIQKRRNHLREKAVEEAELRARSILMALVPSEP